MKSKRTGPEQRKTTDDAPFLPKEVLKDPEIERKRQQVKNLFETSLRAEALTNGFDDGALATTQQLAYRYSEHRFAVLPTFRSKTISREVLSLKELKAYYGRVLSTNGAPVGKLLIQTAEEAVEKAIETVFKEHGRRERLGERGIS